MEHEVAPRCPSLAPELRIIIAMYLRRDGDKKTLDALSRVSRAWQAPAQMSLYETFRMLVTERRTLQTLIAFFKSSPHLAVDVRELGLCGDMPGIDWPPSLEISHIMALVALLPNVRHLELLGCMIKGAPKLTGQPTNQARPCTLSLSGVRMDELAFHGLLSQLVVDNLTVTEIFVDGLTTIPPALLASSHTLELRWGVGCIQHKRRGEVDVSQQPLTDRILSSCPDNLKTFGIACDLKLTQKVGAMCDFLEAKGRHIQHLRLYFNGTPSMYATPGTMYGNFLRNYTKTDRFGPMYGPKGTRTATLSDCCPSLTSLWIALSVDLYGRGFHTDSFVQWRYALRLLASAPHTLTSITIELNALEPQEDQRIEECTLGTVDWDHWDEVLRRFKGLKHLRVERPGQSRLFDILEPGGLLPDDCQAQYLPAYFLKVLKSPLV